MHDTAFRAFSNHLRSLQEDYGEVPGYTSPGRVLDLGGMNVNGVVHGLLHKESQIDVLDLNEGPGVTIVADARTWRIDGPPYDMVISTEMLEHVEDWNLTIFTAALSLKAGGFFVGTAAAANRAPHGMHGAIDPAPDEYYENVDQGSLIQALIQAGFVFIVVQHDEGPGDINWRARYPTPQEAEVVLSWSYGSSSDGEAPPLLAA